MNQRKFFKPASLLLPFLFLTEAAWTQTGTRGGGRTIEIGGRPFLVDLVTNTNCDWWSGPEFASTTPLAEYVDKIAAVHWYFAGALQRELESISICKTFTTLNEVPEEDENDVGHTRVEGEQVAVRVNDEVFIDMNIYDRLSADHQAYLILHEILHGFIDFDQVHRNRKIRSMVAAIERHVASPMTADRFGLQLERNSIDITPQSSQLDDISPLLAILFDITATEEQLQEEACVLLLEQALLTSALHLRDENFWTSFVPDSSDQTPISFAIENGHEACAVRLVESGRVAVDDELISRTERGNRVRRVNLLMRAAEADFMQLAQILLADGGLDHHAIDSLGRNALHYAPSVEMTNLLLAQTEIYVDTTDGSGRTPLHYAAYDADLDRFVALLETGGADLNSQNTSGATPLMLVITPSISDVVQWRPVNYELLDYALARTELEINAAGEWGTALHYAVSRCDIPSVERILALPAVDLTIIARRLRDGTSYKRARTAALAFGCYAAAELIPE